jgi:hypothetical protein
MWRWHKNKVINLSTDQHIAEVGLKPGSGFETAEPEPGYPENCHC